MLWEELTAKQFTCAVDKAESVCVLPIGVLEKHGNHLPLGTDMFTATSVCKAAAEKESAIVFPYSFLGQISEARQQPGTLSVSNQMMMDTLLAMCDEISRNGMKKILIMSGHGGNNHFLPYFAQEMPRLGRDYQVYTGYVSDLKQNQWEDIAKAAGTYDFGYHVGLTETAVMMYLRGDLVDKSAQDPEEGRALGRLKGVQDAGLFTGFNWYADYPHHFAGDHTNATQELGEMIFNMLVQNTINCIKAVKADDESAKLSAEFKERSGTVTT